MICVQVFVDFWREMPGFPENLEKMTFEYPTKGPDVETRDGTSVMSVSKDKIHFRNLQRLLEHRSTFCVAVCSLGRRGCFPKTNHSSAARPPDAPSAAPPLRGVAARHSGTPPCGSRCIVRARCGAGGGTGAGERCR